MKYYLPKNGYIFSFTLQKIPIYIHWTFPIAGIFLSSFFGANSIQGIISLITAYTSLVIVNELGHAIAAILVSSKVHSVLVTGTGGWCFADEPKKTLSKLFISAGGLLAQVLLFIITIIWLSIFGQPKNIAGNSFIVVFVFVNIIFFISNIIPSGETDGKKLFVLLKELYET